MEMPPAWATNSEPEGTESFRVPDGKVLFARSFTSYSRKSNEYTLAQPSSLLLCPSSKKSNDWPKNLFGTRVVPPVFLPTSVDVLKVAEFRNRRLETASRWFDIQCHSSSDISHNLEWFHDVKKNRVKFRVVHVTWCSMKEKNPHRLGAGASGGRFAGFYWKTLVMENVHFLSVQKSKKKRRNQIFVHFTWHLADSCCFLDCSIQRLTWRFMICFVCFAC